MSNRPLDGMRVVVTRPRGQSEIFAAALESAGAEAVCLPVIEIGPIEDPTILDRALHKLACYDWLVLTSVNGVQAVWERLEALGIAKLPEELRIATIGPKTSAELELHGATADFTPDEYIAEAILPGMGDLRGRWALLARADLARPALAEAIESAGGAAHEVAAYRTLPTRPDRAALDALRAGVDLITFTSSSTVRNFIALVESANLDPFHLPRQPRFACIGPITAGTAAEFDLPVSIVAKEYTTEGLLAAIIEHQISKS